MLDPLRPIEFWLREWTDQSVQDVRYGLRALFRNPGFAIVAIVALSIGVGVNVTVFAFFNAYFLKPLDIADPNGVVRVHWEDEYPLDLQNYERFRDGNRTLGALAAISGDTTSLRVGGDAELVHGQSVSGNYFGLLGVPAAIGRMILPSDEETGAAGVAVLSDKYWRRRFASDPSIVGQTVTIHSNPYSIVGVAPVGFNGTQGLLLPDIWVPFNGPGVHRNDGNKNHIGISGIVGRLRAGISIAQAQADLTTIGLTPIPGVRGGVVKVVPARRLEERIIRDAVPFVGFIVAIVGLILLIVCVNIGSLLMARSTARRQEVGIRLAMGAGRWRLMRQILTESTILSLLGCLGAIPVTAVGTVALASTLTARLPVALAFEPAFDWRVVVFAGLMCVLATLLFGLAPALTSIRTNVGHGLRDSGLSSSGSARLREWFTVAQIGMSTVLLVAASLLVRDLARVKAIDPGFVTERVLVADLAFNTVFKVQDLYPATRQTRERLSAFYEELIQQLDSEPGILAANVVQNVPLRSRMSSVGVKTSAMSNSVGVLTNGVSGGHFRTLGIPVIQGRDFQASDRSGSPDVAIVNEAFVRRFWPGENPIGKSLTETFGSVYTHSLEVVGLVSDSKYSSISETAQPMLYRPIGQARYGGATLMVKTSGDPMSALPAVQRGVHAISPDLPLANAMTLRHATELSNLPLMIAGSLTGVLGMTALILAAMGIYGVMSYLVRQRTHEIGIRIALGAQPSRVVFLITRQAMIWTGAGLVIGLLLSIVVSRLGISLIYSLRDGADPLVCIGVSLLQALVACAAAYVPARRASLIDPLDALRDE
jgi:predicted permease